MPTLHLTREPDTGGILRRMTFYVDGLAVARLRRGQSADIEAVVGVHTVEVRMDWLRSEPLTVEAVNGTTVTLTGALAERSTTFASFFLRPRTALELRAS